MSIGKDRTRRQAAAYRFPNQISRTRTAFSAILVRLVLVLVACVCYA